MSEWPTRLVDEDPDFARLVEASRHHEPSSKGFDETLSRVTGAARASSAHRIQEQPAASPLRWSIGHLVAGAALVGAVGFGATKMWNATPAPGSVTATAAGPMQEVPSTVSAPEAPIPILPVKTLAEVPPESAPSRNTSPATPNASGAWAASPRTEEPAAAPRDARVVRGAGESAASSASRASLSEELVLVSAARSALEANDLAACLSAADRYDVRFRAGVLRQEIEVLRITALFRSGERTRGEARARRFLEAHGASPYASQVHSLLESP